MVKMRGLTLIEVLVVMVIIGIVTSVAVLSVGQNQTKAMQGLAFAFAQSMSLAEEKAMLSSTEIGFEMEGDHWAFLRANQAASDTWLALNDRALPDYKIPDDVTVTLQVFNQTKNAKNKIILSTNGDITPFTMKIMHHGKKTRFEVKGKADGSITTERLA